ncbi:hypothetical protein BDZ91DRAFT_204417 [Kalaharituber pfeilii]|nr:hypothetical protein BDZ91DRAFT_204417 [Kalaharituber pfeilii]
MNVTAKNQPALRPPSVAHPASRPSIVRQRNCRRIMGSAASKAARVASQSTAPRRYPPKPQDLPTSDVSRIGDLQAGVGPKVHPSPSISEDTKNEAIISDASDPDFQGMLRRVGIVDSASVMNQSSPYANREQSNPAVHILTQRSALATQAEDEFTNPETRYHRSWVDIGTVRRILDLRDQRKWDAARIEKELGLKEGLVERLGDRIRAT